MNKAIRILAISGLGLLAGAGLGAPALAADNTPNASAKSPTSVVSQYYPGATEIVGFYRTLRGCERAGWMGERRGFWGDHACRIVRVGARSGAWALQVDRDDWRWGAPGFRNYYSGNQFRFRNDGFLGHGPRFGGWVRGPIGNGPFGNYGNHGHYGNHGGGSYGGGGGNYGGGGSYGNNNGGSYGGNNGGSYGGGGGSYGDNDGGNDYKAGKGSFGAGK